MILDLDQSCREISIHLPGLIRDLATLPSGCGPCVLATKVSLRVLTDLGFRADPIATEAIAFPVPWSKWLQDHSPSEIATMTEDQARELADQFGRVLGVFEGHGPTPRSLGAHLLLRVNQRFIFDPSAFQFRRDDRDLHAPAGVFHDLDHRAKDWADGKGWTIATQGIRGSIAYRALPGFRRHLKGTAWSRRVSEPLVQELLWRIKPIPF